jgi:transposase
MSTLDLALEPEPVEVRRFEVITGVGGRRTWPAKARIVAEALEPGANVSAIARRHGLRPQQIFTWRREARRADPATALACAPVVVEEPPAVPAQAGGDGLGREGGGDRAGAQGRAGPRPARRRRAHARHGGPHAQGPGVILPPAGPMRVLVATRPVDFRNYAEPTIMRSP